MAPADADVDALAVTGSPTTMLLSFGDTVDLPGLVGGPNGDTVEPEDLVLIHVTQFGSDTQASFEFYFDGSDVGLDTNKENIDAVSIDGSGDLYLSFRGAYDVGGGLAGKDEDVLRFDPTSTGSTTSGTWSLYFFGAADDAKLNRKGEDVDAHHLGAGGLAVSTVGTFRIPVNRLGEDDDVVVFLPTGTGAATAGTWMNLFDGDLYGLNPEDLDGLHIE